MCCRWGWYQIVVSIDADAAPKAGAMINQSPKIIGLNVGLIVILFILIMVHPWPHSLSLA